MGWTVVKVGGSLFDLPDLGGRLRAWIDALDADHVLLIPGGGALADVIRQLDRIHQLGEERSHWLAIRSLSVNAHFLNALLPEAALLDEVQAPFGHLAILDALPFFQGDEKRPDHLPHTWQVTSDSLAARAALRFEARELILLKSVGWPNQDWHEAARAGVVDGSFAAAIEKGPATRVVNLRAWEPM